MVLKLNSRGPRVKELQELLGLNADGIFGKKTLKAVKDFQEKNSLVVDGKVGPKTWAKMVENKENKIVPVLDTDSNEDFSDPEEEMNIGNDKEEAPASSYMYELVKLIDSSNITRNIKRVVFHCTATSQKATVSGIMNYWRNNLGWKSPGYHIMVRPDGKWTQLLDFNKVSNGVKGINSTTINISYIGGIDDSGKALDNRTPEQKEILEAIYLSLEKKLPNVTFHGHYEFSSKACPSFNVEEWIKSIEK